MAAEGVLRTWGEVELPGVLLVGGLPWPVLGVAVADPAGGLVVVPAVLAVEGPAWLLPGLAAVGLVGVRVAWLVAVALAVLACPVVGLRWPVVDT